LSLLFEGCARPVYYGLQITKAELICIVFGENTETAKQGNSEEYTQCEKVIVCTDLSITVDSNKGIFVSPSNFSNNRPLSIFSRKWKTC
jgi:hypothetical protein